MRELQGRARGSKIKVVLPIIRRERDVELLVARLVPVLEGSGRRAPRALDMRGFLVREKEDACSPVRS